ncbi:hypothetical protein [Kitasatospora sp. NBC_00315]|uniref:hypothetical protein n=1 Tax=Kitasatospora sp. NBC_00315 TaxID=2975963 RepID=UPI003246594E
MFVHLVDMVIGLRSEGVRSRFAQQFYGTAGGPRQGCRTIRFTLVGEAAGQSVAPVHGRGVAAVLRPVSFRSDLNITLWQEN